MEKPAYVTKRLTQATRPGQRLTFYLAITEKEAERFIIRGVTELINTRLLHF